MMRCFKVFGLVIGLHPCVLVCMQRHAHTYVNTMPFMVKGCWAAMPGVSVWFRRHSRHLFFVRPDVGVRAAVVFAIIMSSVVWIVVPQGSSIMRPTCKFVPWDRQDDVTSARAELLPPKRPGEIQWPDWLRQACDSAEVGLPHVTKGKKVNAATFEVVGQERSTQRAMQRHQGPLTNPDREGRLLLDVYADPMDSALVKVIDSAKLKTPIVITNRQPHERRTRLEQKQRTATTTNSTQTKH